MSGCARCCFSLFVIAAQILLNGAMGLCLYWVIQYHTPEVFLFIDLNLEWEMTCFVTTAGQDAVRVEGRHEAAVQPPPGPNDRRLHLLHGPMWDMLQFPIQYLNQLKHWRNLVVMLKEQRVRIKRFPAEKLLFANVNHDLTHFNFPSYIWFNYLNRSDADLPHLPLLPSHLEQAPPHGVPHSGHPLRSNRVSRRHRLPRPEDRQGEKYSKLKFSFFPFFLGNVWQGLKLF